MVYVLISDCMFVIAEVCVRGIRLHPYMVLYLLWQLVCYQFLMICPGTSCSNKLIMCLKICIPNDNLIKL